METPQILALVAALALTGALVALNVWWRRHRAHETAAQKRREDAQASEDAQAW